MNKTQFKKKRMSFGYTQIELSKILGISRVHLSRLENGHCKISKIIGMAMDSLTKNNKDIRNA